MRTIFPQVNQLENQLQKLAKRETKTRILRTMIIAVCIATIILVGSISIDNYLNLNEIEDNIINDDLPSDNQPSDNNTQNGFNYEQRSISDKYVLQLSDEIGNNIDNITKIYIAGNASKAIHPYMLDSRLSIIEGGIWEVISNLINDSDISNPTFSTETFNWTNTQIYPFHNAYLDSLANTVEVEKPNNDFYLTAGLQLGYQLMLENGTGIEFVWFKGNEGDVIEVASYNWDVESGAFGSRENVRYLSPISAFNSFLSTLQNLYFEYLPVA